MKKTIISSLLSFFLILTFFSADASDDSNRSTAGWKAGVARVVITPEHSMWMAGYAKRDHPSEGTLHNLWAKALAIEDAEGERAVLVTTDLLGLPKNISDPIRDQLEEKFGLSRARIILNSSHTHSGPVLVDALKDVYPLDLHQQKMIMQYSDKLAGQIVAMVDEAFRSIEPVRIYAQNGVTRFQVNRRNNDESTLIRQTELKGPNDHAVPVIKVVNEAGNLIAVAFGYACHPTVLDSYKWSGDYPGYAQIELEKSHPGVTALFFQGTGGDQNPLPRRSVALAQQYGRNLASAVERVLTEDMRELSPQLSTAYSEIELPLNSLPTEDELLQIVQNSSGYQKRWATNMLEKTGRGEPIMTSYPYPLQVWQIGDQLLMSLGGEVVIEYAIALKQIFGQEIFVMGYSNDVMAYIPSVTILGEGGYEGATSQMVYGLPGTWKSDIEMLIIREMVRLAEQAGVPQTSISQYQLIDHALKAKNYYSGFELAHDTYNAISTASNGKIYYILSSQSIDTGGQVYVYDPDSDEVEYLADLTDICGEKDMNTIPQGKSHVRFYERNGKLYFSTHAGYYEIIEGMERLPENPPDGYKLYPGGHILSYDLSTGDFDDLAIAPEGEGIITMEMDRERGQIYAITWPKGYFIHYDVDKNSLINLGQISANGEAGIPGDDYRVLCRSMFIDQRDGAAYFSTSEGDIFTYSHDSKSLNKMDGVSLDIDYFGEYDHTRPGSMGYNWRSIFWYPPEGVAYGVHGNSGYLFRFDPREPEIEIVDRITSEPSKKCGMFDQFSYGYLGFQLGPDKQTLYYLTGGPIYIDGQRVKGKEHIAMGAARGLENLHLVTYNIPNRKYIDHGPVYYTDSTRPTYVNSIAIGPYGNVYTLARFEHNGKIIEDLVKIPNPFLKE